MTAVLPPIVCRYPFANDELAAFCHDVEVELQAKARELAGGKNIGVGGADVARQCLQAGLLDEIHIDLVPVLLGSGVRLFEQLGIEPVELEATRVAQEPGVTHLGFRVVRARLSTAG